MTKVFLSSVTGGPSPAQTSPLNLVQSCCLFTGLHACPAWPAHVMAYISSCFLASAKGSSVDLRVGKKSPC